LLLLKVNVQQGTSDVVNGDSLNILFIVCSFSLRRCSKVSGSATNFATCSGEKTLASVDIVGRIQVGDLMNIFKVLTIGWIAGRI
jgi:hypothetical protein